MRQSAAKPYYNKERSTTIENIAIEKYYSEEVSRVHSSEWKCRAPTLW